MHDSNTPVDFSGNKKIALVGNPNVGKSVIFGLLTGQYVTVSNYPGTTVEVTQGLTRYDKRQTILIDTPGINNFIPYSEDERVTRDILLKESIDYVILVGDTKNLPRTLFLALQLAEMNLPYLLVLNMADEAQSLGINTDMASLSQQLGVPVVSMVAVERQGLRELIRHLKLRTTPAQPPAYPAPIYEPLIESAITRISALLPDGLLNKRARALMWLAGDESFNRELCCLSTPAQISEMQAVRQSLSSRYAQPLGYVINQARLQWTEDIIRHVETRTTRPPDNFADALGKLMMHPVWGVFILIMVLGLMYEIVGVLGAGILVDFLENVIFGSYINPAADWLLKQIMPVALVRDFFTGDYGLITMALAYGLAIILPIVGTFFMVFSLLEDSGYLPRLAIMLNKLFRLIGLNGKAILPMVLGLGCGTMATMVTRILPTKKERLIAMILLALGMPCSAQLGVIMGLLSGLAWQATIWWLGTILIMMLVVGYLANKLLIGECADFIMEIPPIRRPSLGNILAKTWARVKWYLWEVIPVFMVGTAILWGLDKSGLLRLIETAARPVITGMLGLPQEATSSFLIGFFRRDYGAAGLYNLAQQGLINPHQITVAIITLTLFVPCFAQFLMMVKERGWKTGLAILAFIFPLAILVGSLINLILNLTGGGL